MKFLLIILLLPLGLVYSQTAESNFQKLKEKFLEIEYLSADVIQSTVNSKAQGRFVYGKGDKFKISFNNVKIVSDGMTIWNYNESENKCVISSVEDNQSIFTLDVYLNEYADKSVFKDNGPRSILLIPNEQDAPFQEITLHWNRDYILNKIEILDVNSYLFTFELYGIKVNNEVSERAFSFNIPEGCRIIDLRK